jgi:acetyl esterase/lipase
MLEIMRLLTILLAALIPAAAQQAAPPAIPADLIWEPDLEYSNPATRLALDIVRPRAASGPLPAIVLIHGGGFRAGNRESYLPLCIKLAQRGYATATVTYRLSPGHQFPAPVYDVKAAVRWLRANAARFGIDPDRIGVTGGSAGGTLALFVGLTPGVAELEGPGGNLDQSSRVSCVVNFYGATDFTKSYGKSVDAADVLPLFLGGDLEHARTAHLRASPLYWVSPNAAPVLSIHGTVDRYVAHEQSVWITERLRAAGVEAELETIEGADHGFKGADNERAEKLMFAYFDKHLARAKQRKLLVADHGLNGEVLELEWPSGKVLRRIPNMHGHDVQPLPDGHILYTIGAARRVAEVDRDGKEVWTYGAAEGLEHPLAAQRLANGNTLIGDAKLGRVIEVDRGGNIVWKYENADLANMRMRNSHRTDSGTTLIAIEAAGKIIEVNAAGEIVWSYQAQGEKRVPYQARRLANGNTLVSMANPGEVAEVDRAGKIVRSIGGANMALRLGWASGVAPLPDGSMFISDYTGKRLLEVDAAGRVLHELRDPMRGIATVAVEP